MSRVGNKPIPLPKGVKINIGNEILVEGPKGKLKVPVPEGISARQADGNLELLRDSDQRAALHGLTRALAAAAVHGVSSGFTRELDITGTGYRADVKGKIATFTLGYSHPIELLLPDGVDLKIDSRPIWCCRVTTSKWSGRWPRTSARCVRPIRTNTRVSGTPAKSCGKRPARPQPVRGRRSKWHCLLRTTFEYGFTSASGIACAAAGSGRGWPCSAA